MVKIKGWNKSMFSNNWHSDLGSQIVIHHSPKGYHVVMLRDGRKDISRPYFTKNEAYNSVIEYMKNNPEVTNNSHIAKYIIVSLDFDGVLAHGLSVKKRYAKRWFGVDLELHQTKKEGFEKLMRDLGRPEINYRSLMDKLNEEHIMEYVLPRACIQNLKALYEKGFRFVIITSRNDHDYPYARMFVKKHFGYLIKEIHNTRNQPKDEFVKRIRPRIHMDDDIKKLDEISHLPVHPLFFRQPENHMVRQNRYKQIVYFAEFYLECMRIKKLHEDICLKYGIENNFRNIEKIHSLEHKM